MNPVVQTHNVPNWLKKDESYIPSKKKERFITRSVLSITSVLEHFRLDDGTYAKFSASAPAKLIFTFCCILLTSLSNNYFFSLIMLALVLLRLCILPIKTLQRVAGIAGIALVLNFLIMLPAIFLGQTHSAILISTKVLISICIALTTALSTPFNELTQSLRSFHVPNIIIVTIDLALKNIVRLGKIARNVLTSLQLRSIGNNTRKSSSLGNIGGVVFLKAQDAAQQTYIAMNCRGFEGQYNLPQTKMWHKTDIVWCLGLLLIIALFIILEKV